MKAPHIKVRGAFASVVSKIVVPYMQVYPEKRSPNRVVLLSYISASRKGEGGIFAPTE